MVVECFLGVLRQKIDQATARQFGYDYAVDDVKLKPLQNQMVGDSNIKMKKQWSDDYHTLPAVWTDDRPEADQQWRKRGKLIILLIIMSFELISFIIEYVLLLSLII